jgi:hypothetical protein
MTTELPTNFVAVYIRDHFDQLLALDHQLCELVGGPPGFTLSSYAYEASTRGKLWARLWRPVIDWLAWRVWRERDHCRLTYELQLREFQVAFDPNTYVVELQM